MRSEADAEREYREARAKWVAEIDDWWAQLTDRQRLQAMVITSNPGSERHERYLAMLRELTSIAGDYVRKHPDYRT